MQTSTDLAYTERFTTGAACLGWHGGLNRADSYVPLIVSYPGGNVTVLQNTVNRACRSSTPVPSGSGQEDCEQNHALPALIEAFLQEEYQP